MALPYTPPAGFRNHQSAGCIHVLMHGHPPPADTVPVGYTALDDAALTDLVQRGEREAFRHIVQRYGRYLYRIARGVFNDDADAEDLVQETFVRAYRNIATFRGEAPLRTWLTSILLNAARSQLRQRHSMVGLDQVDPAVLDPYWVENAHAVIAGGDPAALAAHAEIRRLLQRAIDELPAVYRSVYLLREVEEFSVEATAARLAIKPQTVKTRLHRARRLLRKSLGRTLSNVLNGTFPFLGARCARLTDTLMARLAAETPLGHEA